MVQKVETKDALLHAINEEYVEAVEVLLDHEESIHKEGELLVIFEFGFVILCDINVQFKKEIVPLPHISSWRLDTRH